MDLLFHWLQGCERSVRDECSFLVGLCQYHQVNMTGEDITEERSQTIQTTRCLAADGCHQKFDIDVSMCTAQNVLLRGEQSIMQVLLLGSKENVHRFWFACCKITDISSSRAIDKMRKGM